jgi:protein-tyrosine phosphatase
MNYERNGIHLKVLDLDDMPDFPIEKHFDEANTFIDSYVSKNQSILVVCTAGVSRSAALVISYLIKHKRMPYQKAFN